MARTDGRPKKHHGDSDGVIAALVGRAADRFALRRELRGLGETRFPKDGAGLLSLVRESVVRLVIAEPRDPRNAETAPVVRAIRAAYPSIPILALCDLTADDIHLLVDLVRSGADDAIVRGTDRVSTAAATLLARGAARQIVVGALDEIRDLDSTDARAILAFAVEHPATKRPVEQIARALCVNRRTLVNRLSGAGLPRPSVFVAWGRLLVAASSLADPAKSVRDVARTLGLRSNAGVHVLCRRHSGLSVRALRDGGSKVVLDLIHRELRAARRQAARTASSVGEHRRQVG